MPNLSLNPKLETGDRNAFGSCCESERSHALSAVEDVIRRYVDKRELVGSG